MKTKFATAILTAASLTGFAAELVSTNDLPLDIKSSVVDAKSNRNWFGYMKLGLGDNTRTDAERVLPNAGAGVRYALPVGAVDVSGSYSGDAFSKEKDAYFYRAGSSYLYYFSDRAQSFYLGAGLNYGGLKTNKEEAKATDLVAQASSDVSTDAAKEATVNTFQGVIPTLTVGYEANRGYNEVRPFMELAISQPFLSLEKGSYGKLAEWTLGPVVEFSVGFGY